MRQDILKKINECVKTAHADLENLKITDAEILAIIRKIKQLQPNLSMLNLDQNQLHDEGAVSLANALHGFHQLSTLSLQFNSIGRKGAIALFSLKKEFNHLEIFFHGNEIHDVSEMNEIENLANRQGKGLR